MSTIHLIDDEAMIGVLISHVMTKLGHQVHTYRSAADFFERSAQHPCDLIVTDVVMPRLDGFAFCEKLRERPATADTPIIVMSGFEVQPSKWDAVKTRFDLCELLRKPFTIDMLIASLTRGLKSERPKRDRANAQTSAGLDVAKFTQRAQPRIQAELAVRFKLEDEVLSATTVDVSANGLSVVAQVAPPVFSRLDLLISTSHDFGRAIELQGTVVHAYDASDDGCIFGVALEQRNVQTFYAWYELVAKLQGTDRRRAPRVATRVPLSGPVEVAWSGQEPVTCAIGDLSIGGIRVTSQQRLPSDASLVLDFKLPEQPTPMRAEAEVRWVRTEGAGQLMYGLTFIGLGAEMVGAISHYVGSLLG